MLLEAIITAIIVSIDGLFIGIAVGIKNITISIKKIFIISIIPIIMAIPIMIFGKYISNYLNSNIINYIEFSLFFIMGINSFIEIHKKKNTSIDIFNIIIIGITIGIDSSISAFSLALSNHNIYITPIYFGLFHGILLLIGNRLSNRFEFSNINLLEYLSPILFIILAISKII